METTDSADSHFLRVKRDHVRGFFQYGYDMI